MSSLRPMTVLRLATLTLFTTILLYAVFFADWRPTDLEDFRRDLQLFGPHAPFTVAFLQAILVVFLVPGFLLIIATALLFGYESIWINALGQGLGAIASYLLARFVGHEFVRSLLGQRIIPLQRILHDHAFRYLLLLRFFWFIPLPLLTYGPGFLRVRFRTFLGATMIGQMPFIVVVGLFAPQLFQLRRPSDALDPQFALPAAVLVGMLAIPLALAFVRRRKTRHGQAPVPVDEAEASAPRL